MATKSTKSASTAARSGGKKAASKTTQGKKGGGSTGKKTASSGTRTTSAKNRTASARKADTGAKKQDVQTYMENYEYTDPMIYYEVFLWIVLAFSILLFISYLGIGGFVGEAVSSFFFGCFGGMAYILPFLLFFMTAFLISNRTSRMAKVKATGVCMLYLALCGLLELMLGYTQGFDLMEYYAAAAEYKNGGGLIGGMFVNLFCPAIGVAGAYIMLIIMAIICIVLITQKSLFAGVKHQSEKVYRSAREEQIRRREQELLRREYEQRNPEIYTLSDEFKGRGSGNTLGNFTVLPKEPAYPGRGTSEKDSTLLTGELPVSAKAPSVLLMEPKLNRDANREPRMANRAAGVTFDTALSGQMAGLSDEIRQVLPKKSEETLDIPVMDFTIQRAGETRPADKPHPEGVQDTYFQSLEQEEVPEMAVFQRKETQVQGERPERKPRSASVATEDPKSTVRSGESQEGTTQKDAQEEAAASEGEKASRRPRKTYSSQEEIKEGIENVEQEIAQNAEAVKPEYIFPPVSLLKKPSGKRGGSSDGELRETAQKLQMTLQTFGVNVKVTNVSCGPSITRYELMPEMGVKVSKIKSLEDDIKLNLAAADIRIEAPIPGKAAVGIEIPNKESSGVLFRELLESEEFKNHPSKLAYTVGKDLTGKIVVSDIAKMPHLLVAGATGSGKSVFINTLIMSIIYKAKPDEVKMIMIDPKVVELSVYNGIPHLFIPVVTDPKKAAGALNWAVAEMSDRYNKFAEYGVRNLKGYNDRVEGLKDIEEENKPEKMPQIVIIVDELADLMMVASGEVEDAIVRLTQLARAAGIHLVIATQRPSVDVITGLIKANMPSRVALAVSSGVDSRTILDMNGAEKLLGNGDMLFYPSNYKQPARVQGAYISDEEIASIVDFLKEKNTSAAYNAEMEAQMEQVQKSANLAANNGCDVDELFTDAGKFIIEKDKASIGMLQRWFKIGFNRAARIMDQLSEAGVVGPEEGTKPRKVLMSMEQFENYLEEN